MSAGMRLVTADGTVVAVGDGLLGRDGKSYRVSGITMPAAGAVYGRVLAARDGMMLSFDAGFFACHFASDVPAAEVATLQAAHEIESETATLALRSLDALRIECATLERQRFALAQVVERLSAERNALTTALLALEEACEVNSEALRWSHPERQAARTVLAEIAS